MRGGERGRKADRQTSEGDRIRQTERKKERESAEETEKDRMREKERQSQRVTESLKSIYFNQSKTGRYTVYEGWRWRMLNHRHN